jgi:FkbM family methyltransferase
LPYDADKVVEKYWQPVLAKIQEQIDEEAAIIRNAKKVMQKDSTCEHEWGAIGQYGTDGALYVPCLKCYDALRREKGKDLSVVPNFYKPLDGLEFLPDTDGITKIVIHEIKRDYKLDDLPIKDGDYLVDIGAHKGIVSCYLAKKYPQATVLAFEPVKENFDALLKHLEMNKITNVTAINKAVTADGRNVHITILESDNSGSGNIYANAGVQVPSVTLEQVFEQYHIDRLPLLKIDCEGAEFEILGKANGLLKRVDHLRGEFHRAFGDADGLLAKVREQITDAIVTMQG